MNANQEITIQEFNEKENSEAWTFLNKIMGFTTLGGFLETGFDETLPYRYYLSSEKDQVHILTAEAKDPNSNSTHIIGLLNFKTRTINGSNREECLCFGLKIDPLYQDKVEHFLCYVKSFENTTQQLFSSLGFSPRKKFHCLVEPKLTFEKLESLNENDFPLLGSLKKEQTLEEVGNQGLDREKITNMPLLDEFSSCEEYLGAFIQKTALEEEFLGVQLWRHSLQYQPHVKKLIVPVDYFFSKNAIPVFILSIAVLLMVVFNLFRESSIISSIVVGIYMGIVFAFIKLRALLFAKRKPILCIFNPFGNVKDLELKGMLFSSLLKNIYIAHGKEFPYFKLVLPDEPFFEDFIKSIKCSDGHYYQMARLECLNSHNWNENQEESEYIDPRDIS